MSYPERVETERLRLRRVTLADGDAFAAIWADPLVWQALRPDRPFEHGHGAGHTIRHARHWEEHGFGLWLAELREAPADGAIGWIGAAHPIFIPSLAREVEIGWTLRSAYWGRGLAGEGAREAVAAAFEHLELERIVSLIEPANERSQGVARKLGMTQTGRVRHPGIGRDLLVYELRSSTTTGISRSVRV